MAKVQGKKAAAKGQSAAKKVVAKVKSAAVAAKKKVAAKKPAAPPKSLKTKPSAPAKKKPAPKVVAKVTKAAKVVKAAAKQVVAKAKPAAKAVAKPAAAKPAPKPAAKPVAKPAPAKPAAKPKAAAAPAPAAPAPPKAAPAPPPRPVEREAEKKRGRRARPRVQSSGAPVAAWLSSEKPRPASFIPAPPRAEAPSAIAAPPASSDRLIRPEDVAQPAVRTVPVRIDVEQGAGRFYVLAYPAEVTVRVGEGIEWDFRYLGGADVTVEEIVVEFDRPSPFTHVVFRTRKPGGARPHRQLSDGAVANAAGKRYQYTVRAMTGFKTEVANAKLWLNVTA
ncbi:MAG TPA: hypothetical protein VJZ00_03650 [Thermoanaerobaculia bacterium]|nr:hypothetical protein [Thermoanaerobaculia bacterium]